MSEQENVTSVAPLTRERLLEIFSAQKIDYSIDDDGDPSIEWDGNIFHFLVCSGNFGEVLQILGAYHGLFSSIYMEELRLFIDDWHRNHIWPLCHLYPSDEGQLQLAASVSIDWSAGVSDGQILNQMALGFIEGSRMFEAAREYLESENF